MRGKNASLSRCNFALPERTPAPQGLVGACPLRRTMTSPDDSFFDRFVEAQGKRYADALAEIRQGAKRTHWMWFVFPQIVGIGQSRTAQYFALRSVADAAGYLDHPVIGPRYLACVTALQELAVADPVAVFGRVDARKLQASLTLFEAARPL